MMCLLPLPSPGDFTGGQHGSTIRNMQHRSEAGDCTGPLKPHALRAQLKHTAIRDKELSDEVTRDWSAVDRDSVLNDDVDPAEFIDPEEFRMLR